VAGGTADSVPSRELALGKHINCTAKEYRDFAASFFQEAGVGVARRSIFWLISRAMPVSKDRSEFLPLRFASLRDQATNTFSIQHAP
jgi:hypothetical protein